MVNVKIPLTASQYVKCMKKRLCSIFIMYVLILRKLFVVGNKFFYTMLKNCSTVIRGVACWEAVAMAVSYPGLLRLSLARGATISMEVVNAMAVAVTCRLPSSDWSGDLIAQRSSWKLWCHDVLNYCFWCKADIRANLLPLYKERSGI
jgi:hypothetical protein